MICVCRELQDMDTMNPEYVKELALNKLEQIQHQIDELKEQHKQQHEQLLSELNEVIKFIPEFWFIVVSAAEFFKNMLDMFNVFKWPILRKQYKLMCLAKKKWPPPLLAKASQRYKRKNKFILYGLNMRP
jgi:hypothetical protein